MATLNYAFKEISCKIVYYGCGLCGKTTNLQYIHSTVPGKYRGELVSLATEQDRTLFFDFLPLDLGEVKGFKTKFQLYTVPGQVYYNATRKLVLRGVDGIVFVVDSQRDRFQENVDSLENLKQNLADYGYSLDEIPWVIQYNKRDMADVQDVGELEKALNLAGVPNFESVATTGQGVRETLKGISALVIRNLSQTGVGGAAATPPRAVPEAPSREAAPVAASSAAPSSGAEAPAPSAAPARPAAGVPSPAPAESDSDEEEAPPSPTRRPEMAMPPSARKVQAERSPASLVPEQPPPPPLPPPPRSASSRIRVETVGESESVEQAAKKKAARGEDGPRLDSRQRCDVRWRNLRVGSAQLTLTNRDNEDGRGEYQLSGLVTLLGVFKQSWARLLRYKFRETRSHLGVDTPFFRMESSPEDEGPILTLWVKDGYDQQIFLYFSGFGGPVTILPEGAQVTP